MDTVYTEDILRGASEQMAAEEQKHPLMDVPQIQVDDGMNTNNNKAPKMLKRQVCYISNMIYIIQNVFFFVLF